ncbi:FKBP12-associated protein [Mortierella hygrophila]|uniref:FKBP12-associated protein n=1 Tax=Mortierella hygrophila TaxID=979708 RepID=A0A9P6FC70_9FUNG|nr:FKBP12-associated protein [Mortierella hygrophila]
MSDTPATSSSQQGSQPNPITTNASRGRAGGAKKTTPAAKLNPDAKDYVPRTAVTDGAATTQTGAPSGNNPRHRRRRNPDGNKANTSNPDSESKQPSEGGRSGGNNNSNNNGGNANNRNRRNGGRNPRKAPEGGARIDDYHQDDDIEINMDRPVEPTGSQAAGSDSALGAGSNAQPKGRHDGRRKGKESTGTGTSASSPKPPHSRGDGGHMRGPKDGQSESSSATRGSGQTGSNNRRQRNRKGDLGGRTFPTTSTANDRSTTESSSSQRNAQRNAQRLQPKKFVHTVEEDRDLLAALTTGLSNSTYDCMVCWDVIRPAHKIWNCQVCWAAFHLDCLSTWATKSSEGSNNNGAGWRCPGCQNTQVSIPQEYSCFCGKVNNPDFNRYLTPHSCGELCGRSRECPHPCNNPCHPGPCPPCGGLGPIQSCHCGNDSFQLRCVDTDFSFQTGKSCNQVCGELLGCGKHSCTSLCHAGLCPPCEEFEEQKCYCGKHGRKARCGDGDAKATLVDGVEQLGFYECRETCGRPLACGHHECTKPCHPQDSELGECSARPEVVKTCPCGSKPIEIAMKGKIRTSCLDPIPSCGGVCKKPLNCGHRCMQKCHLGACAPCKVPVTVNCRCGSSQVQRICSDMGLYGDELPTCDRPCRGLRACGKHQCINRCCPAKSQPKGKKGDLAALEAHICTLTCGKKLQCGVHTCDMLCHKGHCNPCMNASFDELSCACGRTVVYPPIPCGTPIPKCRYTCTRARACGHASLSNHPCHPDGEPCPPCIMLVAKQCMCRKSKMPNVPCYKSNPSCGKVCGKRLDCNLHNCNKSCHAGECIIPPTDVCNQPCPKPRKSCGHRCGAACHGDTPCPEDTPCPVIIPSSCKCGHLSMDSACNATADNPWDGKPKMIKCNDYCLIAERNKRVALALDIEEKGEPGPRIPEFDSYVLDYATANMEFTLKIEKQLAEWVADTSKPILYFQPMKGHRRKFVHELAAHYNIVSESVDVEPYRSVTIRRQPNTSVPDLLTSQACRQKRPTSSASTNSVEQLRKPMIKDPVNSIYLHDLAFGLTRSELAAQLAPIFGNIKYGIRWLTDDDAVLVPHPGSLQMDELEAVLVRLRTGIKGVVAKGNLCERVELCWVNKEGEVVSHTNVGGSQARRFFNASQGSQLMKRVVAPKVANAFAILDDDERIAAAKRLEEERILKAKEAAGTLSTEAWEEESRSSSAAPGAFTPATFGSSASRPPSAGGMSQTDSVTSETTEDLTKFVVVEAGEFTDEVVDDWQELLEDDDEEDEALEGDKAEGNNSSESEKGDETVQEKMTEGKGSSSKGVSDDETVVISQKDLSESQSLQQQQTSGHDDKTDA